MIDRDLRIVGVRQDHAAALWRLLTFKETEKARPTVCLALLRDGAPIVVTNGFRRFRLPENIARIGAGNLEAVAKHLHAKIVIAAEESAWRGIVEDLQGGFTPGEDTFELGARFFAGIREALRSGRLLLYPDFFTFVFDLEAPRMRRFFDAVFPKNSSWVVYLFQGQSLEAGLTIVRGEASIETVAGHKTLEDTVAGFYPWQKGYPRILEAVRKKHAPPSLGLFADVDAIRQVLWYPEPGSFLKHVARGGIVIDPLPGWVAAALGVDAVTRVAQTSMDLIRQFDTLGLARRFDLGILGKTLHERLKKEDLMLENVLGFDPIVFMSKLLAWLAG